MKTIKLGTKNSTLVDDGDYEYLSQFNWWLDMCGYAMREQHLGREDGKRKRKKILMHRIIAQTPEGMDTDHINGDRTDNRRSNLRVCTRRENTRNARKTTRQTSSKYKGVCWHKRNKIWGAQIRVNGKQKYLGDFKTEEQAAHAYNEAALEFYGEFANLNFKKAA